MTKPPRLILLFLGSLAVILVAAIWFIQRSLSALPVSQAVEAARFRPPGDPGKPYIEITPDHQLARVQHKDASGLSPLELVQTPQGTVTIQRTFTAAGILVKEEARLNGQVVPVPAR